MALYRITLNSSLLVSGGEVASSNHAYGGNHHRQLSNFLSKRLRGLSRALDERGMVFEASDADDLVEAFDKLSRSQDTDAEVFAMVWSDLVDWCGQTVTNTSGKSVELCSLPVLPRRFGC